METFTRDEAVQAVKDLAQAVEAHKRIWEELRQAWGNLERRWTPQTEAAFIAAWDIAMRKGRAPI